MVATVANDADAAVEAADDEIPAPDVDVFDILAPSNR